MTEKEIQDLAQKSGRTVEEVKAILDADLEVCGGEKEYITDRP